IDRHEGAVAAQDLGPALGAGRTVAANRSIILRAAEVRRAAGIWQAVVELRHGIAVVQVLPLEGSGEWIADPGRRPDGRGAGIGGLVDAAVVAHEHRPDRGAVVARMED